MCLDCCSFECNTTQHRPSCALSGVAAHHNHEDVARGVDDLVQPNDVRVSAKLQDVDLSLHLLIHVQSLDLASVQDFHCDLVPSQHVHPHFVQMPPLIRTSQPREAGTAVLWIFARKWRAGIGMRCCSAYDFAMTCRSHYKGWQHVPNKYFLKKHTGQRTYSHL